MPITMFDHYTVRARDLDVSARFYTDVLGLRGQALDSFEFPMRVMHCGDHAVVHLLGAGPALDRFLGRQAPSHVEGHARRTGNLEHVAFNGDDLLDTVGRLQRASVPYVQRALPEYGVDQLLFDGRRRDRGQFRPDGNACLSRGAPGPSPHDVARSPTRDARPARAR